MAKFRLSRRADADLAGIAAYTIERFGIEQARRYRDGLEQLFKTLAQHPWRGRDAAHLAVGLRRAEFESHVVFYRPEGKRGVLILRVLHERMDVLRHRLPDD